MVPETRYWSEMKRQAKFKQAMKFSATSDLRRERLPQLITRGMGPLQRGAIKQNLPTSQRKSILPVTAQWYPLCLRERIWGLELTAPNNM